MAADFTTVGLIANCKRRGFLPSGTGLDTSAILQVLTEQLRNYVPAFLKSIREEYLVATLLVAVSNGVVAAPARAVGAALRFVKWVNPDGTWRQVARIEPERNINPPSLGDNQPFGYVFQANKLLLLPASVSGTVLLGYQQRPGQLVLPSDCGKITAIDIGAQTLTFASLPASFDLASAYDMVSASPNFDALQMDAGATFVGPTTMEFNGALPAGLAVGDYVCHATETCVPQVPLEVHDLIAQAAASKIANSTGSARKDAIAQALTDLRAELTVILAPRSDGSSRPIVSKSRVGRRSWGW